jgi:two-component system, chemotaxis family, CheB/CheR fusion protein
LNNSTKFMDEGGRIDLAVEADSGQAVLRVRDTGLGIAPHILPTIFDLYSQVQEGVSRSEGGLGIGLNLVRSIIKMHGGSVQASSAGLGHGSEFAIRLPLLLREAQPAPATQEEPRSKGESSARRVLVIDDNKPAADSLAKLLRFTGHEVRTAYDGPTGIELARVQAPDVVFCDIGMPGMSGWEVARLLRRDLGLQNALLVALTGYGMEDDKHRSQEAAFNVHLVKPAVLDDLQKLLARPILRLARPLHADEHLSQAP